MAAKALLNMRFGTIRNNTALKHEMLGADNTIGFGTIRNNTALKQPVNDKTYNVRFGTIRNNTALKPNACRNFAFYVLEPFETTQL